MTVVSRRLTRLGTAPHQEGGPEEYLKHLDTLRAVKAKRDEGWKRAESANGIDRAKFLAEGLNALDSEIASTYYKPIIEEIGKLDPKDETGVTAGFALKADIAALELSGLSLRLFLPGLPSNSSNRPFR